jgi:hypothetical protein
VGHVHHEQRPDLAGDLGEAGKLDLPRVGAGPGDNQPRAVFAGQGGDLVVVDPLGVGPHAVANRLIELAREVQPHAVGQVPAVGQVHRQDRRARLQGGEEDGHIRLCPGVRLDVGSFRPEQGAGPVNRQPLDHVHMLAAAVIPLAGVAFGVFVGQHRALGRHHRRAGVVLRGD